MRQKFSSLYLVVTAGLVVVLLLALLGAFAGGLVLAPRLLDNAQAAVAPPAAAVSLLPAAAETDLVAAYEQTMIDLYRQTVPSVVNINVTQKLNRQTSQGFDFHPFIPSPDSPDEPDEFLNRGQGSGFVWDNSGHIVTNYHVVEDASEIQVIFANGATAPAQMLGGDPNADLAVIKVDLPASALPPVKLGDSDTLQAGQLAIAIGNPFGQDFTMTNGIVSAIGRTIRSGNTPFSIPEVIQTDAPINPGNSGGPLLNRFGEVIGINTQIISRSGGSSGIGFAVPINIAKQVVPTLIKGQAYEYAWLGITGRNLTPDLAAAIDLPADTRGALVLAVAAGGPADEAGLKGSDKTAVEAGQELPAGGDVITAINGQAVTDMDDLITYLMTETRPNDQVKLDVTHADGKQESVTVTLAKRPSAEELSREQ